MWRALRYLKSDPATERIPIVGISAVSSDSPAASVRFETPIWTPKVPDRRDQVAHAAERAGAIEGPGARSARARFAQIY